MYDKWIKVLIHASMWFAPVLVPLIVFALGKDRELKKLSLQALVFHVSITCLLSVSSLLKWILIGFPLLLVFGLIALIVPVTGIVRALQERPFEYPIIKNWI